MTEKEQLATDLLTAIEISGNEFAMGYNDSGCFWVFHSGQRGNGSMLFKSEFQSESAEIAEALQEYLTYKLKDS